MIHRIIIIHKNKKKYIKKCLHSNKNNYMGIKEKIGRKERKDCIVLKRFVSFEKWSFMFCKKNEKFDGIWPMTRREMKWLAGQQEKWVSAFKLVEYSGLAVGSVLKGVFRVRQGDSTLRKKNDGEL